MLLTWGEAVRPKAELARVNSLVILLQLTGFKKYTIIDFSSIIQRINVLQISLYNDLDYI